MKNQHRKVLSNDMKQWLADNFDTDDFAYQCYLVMSDHPPPRQKETCSRECREQLKKQKGIDVFSGMKKSMIQQYGVDNPAKVEKIQENRINTVQEKYGSGASLVY